MCRGRSGRGATVPACRASPNSSTSVCRCVKSGWMLHSGLFESCAAIYICTSVAITFCRENSWSHDLFCLLKGGREGIYLKLLPGPSQFLFPVIHWQVESFIHWGLGPERSIRPPAPLLMWRCPLLHPSPSKAACKKARGRGRRRIESLAQFWLILFVVTYSFLTSWFITESRSHANPPFVSCGFNF